MKKATLFIILSVLLCGCGIKHEARSQMMKSLKHETLDPSSVKVSDEEVVFANDSMCYIDFTVRQKNKDGDIRKSRMEYGYLKSTNGIFENFSYIDNRSFQERLKENVDMERKFYKAISKGYDGDDVDEIFVLWVQCYSGNKIK